MFLQVADKRLRSCARPLRRPGDPYRPTTKLRRTRNGSRPRSDTGPELGRCSPRSALSIGALAAPQASVGLRGDERAEDRSLMYDGDMFEMTPKKRFRVAKETTASTDASSTGNSTPSPHRKRRLSARYARCAWATDRGSTSIPVTLRATSARTATRIPRPTPHLPRKSLAKLLVFSTKPRIRL